MKVIFVRSPYKIVVNETDQLLTKVELYIYAGNDTEPATPTITLERQIPDTINRSCAFDIAPYIKDYIEAISTGAIVAESDSFNLWRKVRVVSSYKDDLEDEWIEANDEDLVAVNGFTSFMGGWNQSITTDLLYLTNADVRIKRKDNNQYFNVLVDFDNTSGFDVIARYRELDNTTVEDVVILEEGVDDSNVYLLKIPYRTADPDLAAGNSVQVRYDTGEGVQQKPLVYFINEDECKYTPVVCTFINRYGGWQYLTFFKARIDNYDVQSKDYKLLPDGDDYNELRGQKKSFNFEMSQKVKLNTGWVEENYIELLTDLLASETILLDNVPSVIANKSIQKKTAVIDKLINYEMDFEYSFNLINDVN